MILIIVLMSGAFSDLPLDRTSDVSIITEYLSAVKSSRTSEDGQPFDRAATIMDSASNRLSDGNELAAYTKLCPLSRVYVALPRSTDNLGPIVAEWACEPLQPSRAANFWLSSGKIVRVRFGSMPVVRIAPLGK